MSYPDGLNHSKKNIANAATCMLTNKIMIQEIVSKGSVVPWLDVGQDIVLGYGRRRMRNCMCERERESRKL